MKSIKKAMKTISSGPKYKEGQAWFEQLSDKEEPTATHFHWSIRNCDGDPALLKSRLSNIPSHYKNEHSACASSFRCKTDPNYEPSRGVITNPKADRLLRNAIESSVIFKSPQDYVLARDTSYVESFNNVNRRQKGKKNYKDPTYCYRNSVRDSYIKSILIIGGVIG